MRELRIGSTVYSRSGAVFELEEFIGSDRVLLFPYFEGSTWEGEPERYPGEHPVVMRRDEVSLTPPKPWVIDAVAQASQQLADLQDKIRSARAELSDLDRQERDRDARIARYGGLERLDDYISGNISHLLLISDSEAKIETFMEAAQIEKRGTYRKELRLITLFGDTAGNLNWRINTYQDDSGSWKDIRLFTNLDDAKQALDEQIEMQLTSWRQSREVNHLARIKKTHVNANRPLPDDVELYMRETRLRLAEGKFVNARKALSDAAAALAEERRDVRV